MLRVCNQHTNRTSQQVYDIDCPLSVGRFSHVIPAAKVTYECTWNAKCLSSKVNRKHAIFQVGVVNRPWHCQWWSTLLLFQKQAEGDYLYMQVLLGWRSSALIQQDASPMEAACPLSKSNYDNHASGKAAATRNRETAFDLAGCLFKSQLTLC